MNDNKFAESELPIWVETAAKADNFVLNKIVAKLTLPPFCIRRSKFKAADTKLQK